MFFISEKSCVYVRGTVHSEDWFELFSEMPELTLETMGEYGENTLATH
jgi:hypothetical protein